MSGLPHTGDLYDEPNRPIVGWERLNCLKRSEELDDKIVAHQNALDANPIRHDAGFIRARIARWRREDDAITAWLNARTDEGPLVVPCRSQGCRDVVERINETNNRCERCEKVSRGLMSPDEDWPGSPARDAVPPPAIGSVHGSYTPNQKR
jgi:hypothetical protein